MCHPCVIHVSNGPFTLRWYMDDTWITHGFNNKMPGVKVGRVHERLTCLVLRWVALEERLTLLFSAVTTHMVLNLCVS